MLLGRPLVKFLDITGITARTSYPKYVVEQIADRKLDGLNRYRIIFAIVAFCFVMEYVSPLGLDFLDLGFFVLVTDLILLGVNSRQTEIVIVILGLMGFYINYKRSFNSSVKKPKHSYIMHLNKKIFSETLNINHIYLCFILFLSWSDLVWLVVVIMALRSTCNSKSLHPWVESKTKCNTKDSLPACHLMRFRNVTDIGAGYREVSINHSCK